MKRPDEYAYRWADEWAFNHGKYAEALEEYADWLEKNPLMQVELVHPDDVEKYLENGWEFMTKTDLKEK